MLHPDLIKSFLSGGLYNIGGVSSPTFQGNPDYQGKLILFSGKPETFTDFSKRATYPGYADLQNSYTSLRGWEYVDTAPFFIANKYQLSFPAATADSDEILTHWGYTYQVVAGDNHSELLLVGELAEPIVVQNGTAPVFPAHTILLTVGSSDG